jgi:hypothetical protein
MVVLRARSRAAFPPYPPRRRTSRHGRPLLVPFRIGPRHRTPRLCRERAVIEPRRLRSLHTQLESIARAPRFRSTVRRERMTLPQIRRAALCPGHIHRTAQEFLNRRDRRVCQVPHTVPPPLRCLKRRARQCRTTAATAIAGRPGSSVHPVRLRKLLAHRWASTARIPGARPVHPRPGHPGPVHPRPRTAAVVARLKVIRVVDSHPRGRRCRGGEGKRHAYDPINGTPSRCTRVKSRQEKGEWRKRGSLLCSLFSCLSLGRNAA